MAQSFSAATVKYIFDEIHGSKLVDTFISLFIFRKLKSAYPNKVTSTGRLWVLNKTPFGFQLHPVAASQGNCTTDRFTETPDLIVGFVPRHLRHLH